MKFLIQTDEAIIQTKISKTGNEYNSIVIKYYYIDKDKNKTLKTKTVPLFTKEGQFIIEHWVNDNEDLPKGTKSDKIDFLNGCTYIVTSEKNEQGFWEWTDFEFVE